ncbi:hypothetical protein [Hyphomicrobium sp.]|uniref:hypothetical protein n=1 Tax=Hyphomicrobium sp. TaxID=82 RepID=UPI002FDFC7B6
MQPAEPIYPAAFAARARSVRADLEAGMSMTLDDIAERLGLSPGEMEVWIAAEMFRQRPDLAAVAIFHVRREALN